MQNRHLEANLGEGSPIRVGCGQQINSEMHPKLLV